MSSADPTYPLLPVACFVSAFLVLLVLASAVLHPPHNFGVILLCSLTLLLDICFGVNTVLWSDNVDLKAEVWCDISTRIELITRMAWPATSLIITRGLYLIISRRALLPPTKGEIFAKQAIEIFLGIGFPAILVGVVFTMVQAYRFSIFEGAGCWASPYPSGYAVLFFSSWPVVFPLISLFIYCPRILWVFSKQHLETRKFLRTNGSVDMRHYLHILAIGLFDALITLPLGIFSLVTDIQDYITTGWWNNSDFFYPGFATVRSWWSSVPEGICQVTANPGWQQNRWLSLGLYLKLWQPVLMSLAIFLTFGLTSTRARQDLLRVLSMILDRRDGDESDGGSFHARGRSSSSGYVFRSERGTLDSTSRKKTAFPVGLSAESSTPSSSSSIRMTAFAV